MSKRILVIVQRSNGDVFLATPLIEALQEAYPDAAVDLLVNRDTLAIARTLPHIATIHTYDYSWKKLPFYRRFGAEAGLLRTIAGRYDLAINLTASDRSVLYARLAAKRAISCVEAEKSKSWWKRLVLSDFFLYDTNRHIVEHTAMPLKLLGIMPDRLEVHAHWPEAAEEELKSLPFDTEKPFLIFHPSAQYDYKIYPRHLRDTLLQKLDTLQIPIVVTGGKSAVDERIAGELPDLANLHNLIGKTSLAGYIALCNRASAYIGMDTLNMHIAAALDKPIFAIFGPTLPQVWSPWCNALQRGTDKNAPIQHYGNVTLFQADMECVACGKAGCDDRHGRSDCLYAIDPDTIFREVQRWLNR
ncbi:glycosyltransferase family 9 protein [Hydrogenimonas sp.]